MCAPLHERVRLCRECGLWRKIPDGSAGRPVSRVLSRAGLAPRAATVIYLAPELPPGSSGLPEDRNGAGRPCPLFDLAPGGVCRADRSPGRWCALTLRACAPHRFTLTRCAKAKVKRRTEKQDGTTWSRCVPGFSLSLLPFTFAQRAVYFLLHCPARWRPTPGDADRYRGWALPTTSPCGARTFLPQARSQESGIRSQQEPANRLF
jgi:hypothetical protein